MNRFRNELEKFSRGIQQYLAKQVASGKNNGHSNGSGGVELKTLLDSWYTRAVRVFSFPS
jgi:hypothetical protein